MKSRLGSKSECAGCCASLASCLAPWLGCQSGSQHPQYVQELLRSPGRWSWGMLRLTTLRRTWGSLGLQLSMCLWVNNQEESELRGGNGFRPALVCQWVHVHTQLATW